MTVAKSLIYPFVVISTPHCLYHIALYALVLVYTCNEEFFTHERVCVCIMCACFLCIYTVGVTTLILQHPCRPLDSIIQHLSLCVVMSSRCLGGIS